MSSGKAKLLLMSVFMARGTSFIFSKFLMTDLSPMSILAVRFCLAFLILSVIFLKKLKNISKRSLRGGLILGVLYTVCMIFEMYGLRLIDSGVSSLVENMAIVLVPLFVAVATRKLPKSKTIICAVIAIAGVGFLSLTQSSMKGGTLGILLTVCAAICYALCIISTEKVSQDADPIAIGVVQMGTMGVLSLIVSLFTEGGITIPQTGQQWAMLLVLVLLCSCFGFTFQPLGQKYVPAETAAVLTVVNPLTSSVLGILVGGEGISVFKIAGYVLILSALLLYNIRIEKQRIDGE